MACVPPRAGFESARKLPIAQGVPLSHRKMKQILVRSSLWHKTCRGWLPVLNVRNMASQAVGIEEMGAIEAIEASEKKKVHRQRWQAHETMALIAAKKQQDLMGVENTEATGIESKKTKNNWMEIEAFCREKGIERSAQQCQTRWFRLMSAFTQIRSWEETRKPEQPSFWSLKLDERKTMGFLLSLDQKTYNALDELYNSKADAIENVLVKDDDYAVVEVAELGSVNHMPHGYDGEAHEIKNKTNLHTSSYKTDEMVHTECLNISKPFGKENNKRYARDAGDDFLMEELDDCRREKHVDQCIAMENTKILSEFLQKVMDDRQLPHVSTGKTDLNPRVLHTGQQVESLKVSGLADHADPLCGQEDANVKAQLLPASAEAIDGSNKDSCKVPLVEDDCNKAQLLHACAENVDYNPTNLRTGQHTESLKYFRKGEHIISKSGCGQEHMYDKAELLPASAEMIDGSNKDSCKGSLEEGGTEENTIVIHGDDDNVPFSCVMYDEILQAAQDEGIEKGDDGSLFKIHASVTDSVVVEGIANANSVFASVESSCECQKSESHLSSAGVDALNARQSLQITGTALSSLSVDKEDSQNYFVDRILAEEAWIDKNEKGEGCEVNSFLCLKSTEDISTAQNKNDAGQMRDGVVAQLNNLDPMMEAAFVRSQKVLRTRFEQQQGDLNPLLAFKEEIGTGVLKQGPEVNSTFPTSENIESTCSDQDKEYEKFELRPSEEGHIEMIADMTHGNATMLECSTGHSFEEKEVEHLQIGNNEYNKKITEPSQSIKHFEVAVKDGNMFAKKEPYEQIQSDHKEDGNDTNERMKEGDCLIGKMGTRASTVDTNPPSLTCIHNQFQHAPEQKSTIKGDAGSFESVTEASRAEVAANEPKELEFIIKDDRATPVTVGKGSIEDRSQKTSTSSPADEDVFMYVSAATGTLVKSALQTIRKFFKF